MCEKLELIAAPSLHSDVCPVYSEPHRLFQEAVSPGALNRAYLRYEQ